MIPKILHFVFGMAPDFGGKPFSLPHYLAIRSAIELNKPEAVYFHYEFEPAGEWWEAAKPLLTLNQLRAPSEFLGRKLQHVAHKADIVRLQVLKQAGGIYMDLDTISVRPLDDLLAHDFVIGQELSITAAPRNFRQRVKRSLKNAFGAGRLNKTAGLCNAVLLSEKESPFINRWLASYDSFRSTGRDKYWNEHSVIVPGRLAAEHPNELYQVSPYAFHYPLYNRDGLVAMFEREETFPDAYLHHLWESFSWEPYLSKLTVEDIHRKSSTYNRIARQYC